MVLAAAARLLIIMRFPKVKLNLRTLHNVSAPTTEVEILGRRLALPVLGAAVAGTKINFQGRMDEDEFCQVQVQGALAAGTIALTGDGGYPEVFAASIKATKAAKERLFLLLSRVCYQILLLDCVRPKKQGLWRWVSM